MIRISLCILALWSMAPVWAADAYLIRFEAEGDWSGTVAPTPRRLAGWQFSTGDAAAADSWKCAARVERYWDTPYERSMRGTSQREKLTAKGILVEYDRPTEVRVVTRQGSFSFSPAAVAGEPRAFLNGRAQVRAVPLAARWSTEGEVEDFPSLLQARDGTLWIAYQSWTPEGDRVFVRRRSGAAWSAPELVAGRGDYFRTAIAQDRNGAVWVVWAAQENGNFDLHGRAFDGRRWLEPRRLTSTPGSDIYHALAADAAGNLFLVWQSSRSGNFDIWMRRWDGLNWSGETAVSTDAANDWEPALAAAPDGRVTILWDTYARGNYDVVARTWERGRLGPEFPIAQSGAFEARASAQYDARGRLWAAWEEGDWNWGKDYGNLVTDNGRGLMVRRQARVAVLVNGRLMETAAPLAAAVPEQWRQAYPQPRLVLDGAGAPWLFFRYRTNLPLIKGTRQYRGMWRAAATTLRGGRWVPMIEFPEGWGRMDAPLSAAAGRDGIEVAWVSDGRGFPDGFPRQQDLYVASLASGAAGADPEMAAYAAPAENLAPSHPSETADVTRVRAYRAQAGGRALRIVRGDVHRHTDLSWDGNRDGSLDDAYRYALDAAGFDFLGVCDHQAGESIPYHWRMIQRAVDLFTIAGHFAPVYSYERSLPWPNGHRNVFFAEKGRPVFDPSPAERHGEEGAAKLYAYLRRFGGLTSSHTSATGAGTDWRDNDPDLEPVVEIYQGYRNNYEGPDVPREAGGRERERFSAGLVSSAWAKGLKLGVQSSSDHVSTHISYAAVYVDRVDRAAIFEGLKARRSFAATDNLVIDFRAGDHFMGDAFAAQAPPPMEVFVRGTGPLARVHVIRNNRVVYTAPGTGPELRFTFTDTAPEAGESFYYVRAEQQDGQLAWSSPVWVKR